MLVIFGATGVGKSAFAVELAKRYNGEVISADSMQIYKYCDIGTAKITPSQMQGIRHHMLDIIEPDIDFSVSDYRESADAVVKDIIARGKTPIVVGGTGFYIKGLLYDFGFGDTAGDENIRRQLLEDEAKNGEGYLYQYLTRVDEGAAARIHPNDTKRIVRAIEVFLLTGKRKSDKVNGQNMRYPNSKLFALNTDRQILYDKINARVDDMLKEGLVDEVISLKRYKNAKSMQAIGYKEIFMYLDGLLTLSEAAELIKKNTRHYAKRQLTFARTMEAYSIDVRHGINAAISEIAQLIKR